jgi:hypothetical protein
VGCKMKFAIRVVKITSSHTDRKVWEYIISKVEPNIKNKTVKIKYLPRLKDIKEAIRKDIFGE